MVSLLGLTLLLGWASTGEDTLRLRSVERPPPAGGPVDSVVWGVPQVRIATGQGAASVWLLRWSDTVFVVAAIPDSTPSWRDELAISFDVAGDRPSRPEHQNFQWSFRRLLDSSVVYRGRNGRWEPPRDDPDWRLGGERSGGGWEVSASESGREWVVIVRMDPAWFAGQSEGRRPAIAFRIYDDAPSGWFAWPDPHSGAGATLVERTPALWVPVQER